MIGFSGMEKSADRLFIDYSVSKLEQLSERIETCLGKLTEEQIWGRGAQNENAVGNLALHLCGNVRQWILAGVGGEPDIRDRDAEFAALGGVTGDDLRRRLRDTVKEASAAMRAVSA